MTLSHIFDVAGLQLRGLGGPAAQQAHVQAVPGPLLGPAPASLQPPASGAGNPASLHPASLSLQPGMPAVPSLPHAVPLHMQAAAPLLPPGLTPAGPFASGSLTMSLPPGPASLPAPTSQPASLPPAPQHPASLPPGVPTSQDDTTGKAPAAAARAARAKKRKDASSAAAAAAAAAAEARPAGGLTAAEAARQAKAVAERAAAELEQLPADLDEKEARAIKRAVRRRCCCCRCCCCCCCCCCRQFGLPMFCGRLRSRSNRVDAAWRPAGITGADPTLPDPTLHYLTLSLPCAPQADQEQGECGPLTRQAAGVHRHAGAEGALVLAGWLMLVL